MQSGLGRQRQQRQQRRQHQHPPPPSPTTILSPTATATADTTTTTATATAVTTATTATTTAATATTAATTPGTCSTATGPNENPSAGAGGVTRCEPNHTAENNCARPPKQVSSPTSPATPLSADQPTKAVPSSARPPPEKRRKFDAFGTPRSSKAGLGSRVNV